MTAALDAIRTVETFIVKIPRDTPYLGPLREGERPNAKGYIVRRGNRTIYPTHDMSVLIKVTGESGRTGWGETYGIAAPQATKAIIDEVLGPVMVGRDPGAPVMLHEDLYDLMRVRGACGGYFGDALAGVDIAVWDLFAKALDRPLASLLGGCRHPTIPAYVSGLPAATLRERCDLALDAVQRGFRAIKIAAVVSDEGVVAEIAALREAVGPNIDLMVDLHWKYTPSDAIRLIRRLEAYDVAFAEAPCAPEDVEGQAQVARSVPTPLALGEEWHSVHDARPRFERRAMGIVQPEIGHTGVTEFMGIGRLAQIFQVSVVPHATVGVGIFLAASLHAASSLQGVVGHEYQPSIFDRNLRFVTGDMACEAGAYRVPSGAGHGVEPHPSVFEHVMA